MSLLKLIFVAIIIYLIYVMYGEIQKFRLARDSQNWRYMRCRMLDIFEEKYTDAERIVRYRIHVRYEYKVGQTQYIGTQLNFANSDGLSKRKVKKILSQYQINHRYGAYYNPQNPSESVLNKGVTSENAIDIVLSIGFAFFLGVLVIFGKF